MCGIAGGVALRPEAPPDARRVRDMARRMAHRGPDGEGYWQTPDGRALFGHRRLSVIDLATGAQPMTDESGRTAIVFNGEIYNYRELRRQLETPGGVRFRTASDTEVLLALYLKHGPGCVHMLRGMFAFAIWDGAQQRLLLARDRVGKKPLFYTTEDGVLYFASSLAALRDTARRPWQIDLAGIDAFLHLSYIPAPQTAYVGVAKLGAGTLLTLDRTGQQVTRYWSWPAETEPFDGTFAQAADRLDELLQESVRLRLRSDVPLGVFLSGGVDSSLVAAVATRLLGGGESLQTFSIGFAEQSFDERPYAAQVAQHLGSAHRAYRAHADLLQHLPDMVRHFGEPYGDSSALATWLLAARARAHVTVALNGDGGDEGFGGYDWYRTALRLRAWRRWAPGPAWRLAGWMARGRLRRGLAVVAQDDGHRFAALRAFIGRDEGQRLYAGELAAAHRENAQQARERLATIYRDCGGGPVRRMRCVDIETYLADCLMPKVDVATMAHGLEARSPLLDHELLRFALGVPDDWLVDRQHGKKLLKAVLGRYLPLTLFERPKSGFTVPLAVWFNGELAPAIQGLLNGSDVLRRNWVQRAGLASLIREHRAGARDHSQRLFNILMLDAWAKGTSAGSTSAGSSGNSSR